MFEPNIEFSSNIPREESEYIIRKMYQAYFQGMADKQTEMLKQIKEGKFNTMYKMYGFYNKQGKLIDKVLATDTEMAKEKFNKYNPDTEYMYVEVMF